LTFKRHGVFLAGLLVVALALVAAGCGGDDGGEAPEALPSSSCTAIEYEGDGNPDYTVGIGNDFKWRALSAYILIDRQQGGMLAAGTWRHYDLGGNSRDYDVKTKSGERLGDQRVRVYRNVTRTYYQDASFTKIREITLGARVPRSWLARSSACGICVVAAPVVATTRPNEPRTPV